MDKITQFPKLAALETEQPDPSKRRYRYKFRDGSEKDITGFLMVTNSFIASGQGESADIVFWAPSADLISVEYLGDEPTLGKEVN